MPELRLSNLTVNSFRYLLDPQYYSVRQMYLFGSRKSAKTKHVALRFIKRILEDPEYNALALRKTSSELTESVAEELEWAITTLMVPHLFTFKGLKKGYVFTYKPTGQRILLKGISINPASGKPSLSGLNIAKKGRIKDVWMEEAWEFTYDDFKMIRGTIRGGAYTLLMVGNPYFASMWCVKRAIDLLPPTLHDLKTYGEMWGYFPADPSKAQLETIVHWSNLFINTKLSQEDLEERMEELRTNPKDAMVTVYGMVGSPSGTILGDLADRIKYVELERVIGSATEYAGGVDVGLENDAMTAVFGGVDHKWNLYGVGEYYHSNGKQECNQHSDGGVWRFKDPHELGNDVIDFFMAYESMWRSRGDLIVSVDNADSAQISILNNETRRRGIRGLRFAPTKGNKFNKTRIESRIIFERNILAKGLFHIVEIDGVNQMSQLLYEINNIPWKRNQSNGTITLERDGSKVHPDMTNAWEYWFRRWREKIAKYYELKDNGV